MGREFYQGNSRKKELEAEDHRMYLEETDFIH
jgi:hypothetical protein